ncbi:EF-hand domain-containing protein [Sphingobium sp.]|uniref:EF-hand domain-containing protein n=1 Tax=Sphingobium sp. TaxID=1912891 RepID=UPI003BB59A05
MRGLSLGLFPLLLFCSVPALAQDSMGGMGGMDSGGMQGGGGRPGGGGGGPPGGMGGPRRPALPKPIKRDRFDKMVTDMFRTADVNRDGMVTIDELRTLFETRRADAIRARFARIDTNRNGAISQDEFIAWQTQMGSVASSEVQALGDRNGPIAEAIMPDAGDDPAQQSLAAFIEPLSVTLIAQANVNYDAGLSLQELLDYEGKRFDAADANHDGWLTLDELRPLPRRGPGAGPGRGPRPGPQDARPMPCPTGQTC